MNIFLVGSRQATLTRQFKMLNTILIFTATRPLFAMFSSVKTNFSKIIKEFACTLLIIDYTPFMKLSIFECQPGMFCRPTEDSTQDGYKFLGKKNGGYVFETREGKRELFGRSKYAPAGWHLKRGKFCFEFCSSPVWGDYMWKRKKK